MPKLARFVVLAFASIAGCGGQAREEPGRFSRENARESAVVRVEGEPAPPLASKGPTTLPFLPGRHAYVAIPEGYARKRRLVVHLHGLCADVAPSCSPLQSGAARNDRVLVCPEGGERCDGMPSWGTDFERIARDVDVALATARGAHGEEISDDAPVLSGFSKGAEIAWQLARRSPGRWPHLVLMDAEVRISAPELRAAGVTALSLVTGEQSAMREWMKVRFEKVAAGGFPVKLWVMPGVGHRYSENVGELFGNAVAFASRETATPRAWAPSWQRAAP